MYPSHTIQKKKKRDAPKECLCLDWIYYLFGQTQFEMFERKKQNEKKRGKLGLVAELMSSCLIKS